METFFISEKYFTPEELKAFKEQHKYDIKDIDYTSTKEIDFTEKEEKAFLLQKGYPKILARFFA